MTGLFWWVVGGSATFALGMLIAAFIAYRNGEKLKAILLVLLTLVEFGALPYIAYDKADTIKQAEGVECFAKEMGKKCFGLVGYRQTECQNEAKKACGITDKQ